MNVSRSESTGILGALQRKFLDRIKASIERMDILLDDLFQIGTMGFRGEALASISAISRFTMLTRTKDCATGSKITFEDGVLDIQDWNGEVGTQITIKDIFYNVPARKNFLKSNSAEFAQCNELVQSLALSLPQIGFVLKHNGREIMRVSPLDIIDDELIGAKAMEQRALDVLSIKDLQLCYLHESNKYGSVEAMISPPGFEKSTGKHIFMFVNGRWVKDKNIRFSILRGYHSHLLKGRFPVCIVHLQMDPSLVDVNVHPSKAEVRFQYTQEVQSLIALSIRDRLREGDWASSAVSKPTPSFDSRSGGSLWTGNSSTPSSSNYPVSPSRTSMSRAAATVTPPKPVAEKPSSGSGFSSKTSGFVPDFDLSMTRKNSEKDLASRPSLRPSTVSAPKEQALESRPEPKKPYIPRDKPTRVLSVEKPQELSSDAGDIQLDFMPSSLEEKEIISQTQVNQDLPWGDMEFMGAFNRCYLFFSYHERLVVVDQHAFHERVLYERLKNDRSILKQVQPLLMPEVIQLSPSEATSLKAKESALEKLGIGVKVISECEAEVSAVPSILKKANLEKLLTDFANEVSFGDDMEDASALAHDVLSTMACHSAVRAGEELPPAELEFLLREADNVDFYHNCPHGRPVVKIWKKSQVEGWFER